MNQQTFYQQLQKDAEGIVEKAAALLRSYENTFKIVNQKDEGDMSTSADIASEKLIIGEIKKRYPTHSIYSEEAGLLPGTDPYTWIIDPLDGTKEFARHAPEYNCLIAVEHGNRLVVGVIKRNGINELYSCSRGSGAFLNGNSVHVSSTNDISKAFISFYLPNKKFPPQDIITDLGIFTELVYHCYRVRGNNDESKAFAWVARGIYDADIFVPGGGEWHDIAPGILFVEEAGGKVTNWQGEPVKNRNAREGILASNGIIHEQVLKLIQKAIKT